MKENEKGRGRANTLTNIIRKVSSISIRNNASSVRHGIPITPNCKFKLVVRTTKPELTVSFLIANMPGYAVCAGKSNELCAERISNDIKFVERSSFYPCVNLWYDSFCAFECIREASRYITYENNVYLCRKYDGTDSFKQQASFLFQKDKKPDSPRRRAHSSIIPPKQTDLHIHSRKRKFSLNHHKQDEFRTNERNLVGVQKTSALYTMHYSSCFGCLNLTPYVKDPPTATDEQNE